MDILATQRWRDRHHKWIPRQALFQPADYAVDVIPDRMAKPFIERHHYSGSYPASRLAIGLFRQSQTGRSEERRVGKEWVSTCRSRWSRNHSNTKRQHVRLQQIITPR